MSKYAMNRAPFSLMFSDMIGIYEQYLNTYLASSV